MIHINLTNPSVYIPENFNLSKTVLWAGGEIDLRINDPVKWSAVDDDTCTIYTRLNCSEDIMKLFLTADLFKKVHVVIPYLPYARQDRACRPGEPFSLRVIADLFNSQKFKSVRVFDPHSNVSEFMINNIVPINNHKFVSHVFEHLLFSRKITYSNICLVSPDAGAQKKIYSLADHIGHNIKTLTCFKTRSDDGKIKTVYVPQDKLDPNLTYVIVDDICDSGKTSVALITALKEKGADDLHFVTSHGIFSGSAIDSLQQCGVKNIWTTTSIAHKDELHDGFVHYYDVFRYMKG